MGQSAFRGHNPPQTPKIRTLSLNDLIRAAHDLSDSELHQLQDAVAALVEIRDLGDADEPGMSQIRTLNPGRSPHGSIEKKRINGCGPYSYLRWWSGGKHKSTYLGKDKGDG